MRIAIFGGSFNPPHIMHKQIALNLVNNKYVDKVIFVPTGNKYRKDELIDDIHRFNMLEIYCEHDERLDVSNYELGEELKYTYQTLDYFQSLYPTDELFFVLGFDNLEAFKTWRRYEYILENYKLLVVDRDDIEVKNLKEEYKKYLDHIIFTDIQPQKIASKKIRYNLKKYRYSDMIEPEVLEYILDNKLYI